MRQAVGICDPAFRGSETDKSSRSQTKDNRADEFQKSVSIPKYELPTRQTELLCLLLDIFIVGRGGLFGRHLTGSSGNTELGEERSLDRRKKFKRGIGISGLDVRVEIVHNGKNIVRKRCSLDQVRACWRHLGCHRVGTLR